MNNQGKKMFAGIVLVAGVILAGVVSNAAVLIEWQDGSANAFAGWASDEAYVDGGSATFDISGQNGAANNMVIDPDIGTPSLNPDVHYTTAFNGDFTQHGDYAGGDPASLRFDFYASADGSGAGAPAGLGFYFATSSHEWYYDIDTSYIADGWNTFSVQLDESADAYGSTAWYEEDFQSGFDISAVTRVGMWIAYNPNNSTQNPQIGLYGISVPEPETYLILGMALLSVAVVFRKRISESMAEARAMMRM